MEPRLDRLITQWCRLYYFTAWFITASAILFHRYYTCCNNRNWNAILRWLMIACCPLYLSGYHGIIKSSYSSLLTVLCGQQRLRQLATEGKVNRMEQDEHLKQNRHVLKIWKIRSSGFAFKEPYIYIHNCSCIHLKSYTTLFLCVRGFGEVLNIWEKYTHTNCASAPCTRWYRILSRCI